MGEYENYDACVADNQDKDDPEAYCAAIKRSVEGAAALSDKDRETIKNSDSVADVMLDEDPCWEGYTMVGTKEEGGRTVPNCVPDDDVPDANLSDGAQFALADLKTEPIEREELSDDTVVYRNVMILQSGTWTDSGSGETIWYSPRGLQNLDVMDNNTINIMHDAENDVSDVGKLTNAQESDGELYADLEIDTSNSAGAYADENLAQTLQTNGAKGFGGPSVEIEAEGQEVIYNEERDIQELTAGKISGLGLVANPASKPTAFARQTAQRGVALSEGQTLYTLDRDIISMADADTLRDTMESAGLDTEGMDDEEVMDMAESLHDELMSELTGDMDMEEGVEDEDSMDKDDTVGMREHEEDDEDDEDEEEMDMMEEDEMEEGDMDEQEMMERMQAIEQRIGMMEEEIEQMEYAASQQMSELKHSLADAEAVGDIEATTEHLEKRLSELEDKPDLGTRKSLAGDGADAESKRDEDEHISFVRDPSPY